MTLALDSFIMVVPRAWRINLLERLIIPWRLPVCALTTLLVAVSLKRFLTLLFVFNLGIFSS
jgi:hypothetical protein